MSIEQEKNIQPPMFFDAVEIGQSLHEVAADLLQVEGRSILSRWYHSHKDADIFIWLDEKHNVIKQQVTFCGQVVEWNVVEGVKTGYVHEDETEPESMEGSPIIRFDDNVQSASLEQAVAMVEHAEALPEEDRQRLVENYRNPERVTKMDPKEFLRRYGPVPPPPSRPRVLRPSLWQRIKQWLFERKP